MRQKFKLILKEKRMNLLRNSIKNRGTLELCIIKTFDVDYIYFDSEKSTSSINYFD